MPTISAVINTRNEEKNIRYCLASVKWCDEIIVVDMESEDKTVAIAREYTAKIFTHEKVLAFDVARKFAVEQATGDWILLIDADELITKSLTDKLKEIVQRDDTDIVYIPFKTYIMGEWIKHSGWWPDYHPRFFKKGSITFVKTVHAFMEIQDKARKTFLPASDHYAIEHFNYLDSEHFIEKLNRYTNIEAQQLFESNKRFSLFRMFLSMCKEFRIRFILNQGYKDGYRGFFLGIMMVYYRMVSHIKLWEIWQYKDKPVQTKYAELKEHILSEYDENKQSQPSSIKNKR